MTRSHLLTLVSKYPVLSGAIRLLCGPDGDLVRHPLDPSAARLLPLEVARRMFAVPVRFTDSGAIEVAVGDPGDADVDGLEQILGRRVELVVGERSVIQDAWRYMR